MNETFEPVIESHARCLKWRGGRELSKQFGLGRWASFAMLSQTRADVNGPPDFDPNEVRIGCVWMRIVGMHTPDVFRRSTYRRVQVRRCIRPDRSVKYVEPSSDAARAACEVQARRKQTLKRSQKPWQTKLQRLERLKRIMCVPFRLRMVQLLADRATC